MVGAVCFDCSKLMQRPYYHKLSQNNCQDIRPAIIQQNEEDYPQPQLDVDEWIGSGAQKVASSLKNSTK